jgi:hypothetical protein
LLASYGKRYWEFHSNASNGDDDEDNEEEQVHEVEIHVEDGGIIEVLSE